MCGECPPAAAPRGGLSTAAHHLSETYKTQSAQYITMKRPREVATSPESRASAASSSPLPALSAAHPKKRPTSPTMAIRRQASIDRYETHVNEQLDDLLTVRGECLLPFRCAVCCSSLAC